MPKDREFYDDEDPWDMDEHLGEQLELPLQFSSNSAPPTVKTSWPTNTKGKWGSMSSAYHKADPPSPDVSALLAEMFQQIMDRLDSLEDALLEDRG